MSFEQAGALPLSMITAYEAMVTYGKLKKGEWVLIAGASSGAGVARFAPMTKRSPCRTRSLRATSGRSSVPSAADSRDDPAISARPGIGGEQR